MPIQKLSPNFEAPVGVEANKYQYNGIEIVEDFGLHVNHAAFRTLDPQTGAWWQIDPKPTYNISNYAAMANNPILYSDILGDTIRTNFGKNQVVKAAYNLWSSTKESKKFHKVYGEGANMDMSRFLLMQKKPLTGLPMEKHRFTTMRKGTSLP